MLFPMIPAHIAENVRKQILYYLQSTFAFRDRKVESQFEAFLNDPENGMFTPERSSALSSLPSVIPSMSRYLIFPKCH